MLTLARWRPQRLGPQVPCARAHDPRRGREPGRSRAPLFVGVVTSGYEGGTVHFAVVSPAGMYAEIVYEPGVVLVGATTAVTP
jgi:hypothetical protein